MNTKIPEGVYEADVPGIYMFVDNLTSTISTVMMGRVAVEYKYEISGDVITMRSQRGDGVVLRNHISFSSDAVKFKLHEDKTTLTYVASLRQKFRYLGGV
jgi:hypothetical protein